MNIKSLYIISALFLLNGCGSFTRTEYQRPELTLPQKWDDKIRQSGANDVITSVQGGMLLEIGGISLKILCYPN